MLYRLGAASQPLCEQAREEYGYGQGHPGVAQQEETLHRKPRVPGICLSKLPQVARAVASSPAQGRAGQLGTG